MEDDSGLEYVEAIPQNDKESDPFFNCRIRKDGFGGKVDDIEQGAISKERLYRIRYDDGDMEHLDADEMLTYMERCIVISCQEENTDGHHHLSCARMSGEVLLRLAVPYNLAARSLRFFWGAEVRRTSSPGAFGVRRRSTHLGWHKIAETCSVVRFWY